MQVQFLTPDGEEDKDPRPPFRVTLMKASKPAGAKAKAGGRKRNGAEGENVSKVPESISEKPKILVETYVPPDPGPYPQDQPKKNSVRFTPVQVIYFPSCSSRISSGLYRLGSELIFCLQS